MKPLEGTLALQGGEKVSYFVRVEQLRLSFWQASLGLKSLSETTEIKHANKNKIKARKPKLLVINYEAPLSRLFVIYNKTVVVGQSIRAQQRDSLILLLKKA